MKLWTVLFALLLFAAPARAGEPEVMIEKSIVVIERIRSDDNLRPRLDEALAKAKGVLIVPDLVKGGFIIGAEYGGGVLMTRNDQGDWSYPAFYQVGGGSVGLQIGVQDSEMVYVLMTEKGLEAVMKNKFKAEAGVSIAAGTFGAGMQAGTTTALGADVLAFAKAVGAFGGGSLGGTAVLPRDVWNRAYYGAEIAPETIVVDRKVTNPQADRLRGLLAGQR